MPTGIYPRKPKLAIIPIGPSIAYIPLTQGYWALIDREDAQRLEKFSWRIKVEIKNGAVYARRGYRSAERRVNISMQAEILGLRGSRITADHINRVTLDNRKCNLRPATRSEQNRNQGFKGVSGVRGVTPSRGKWRVRARINGKRLNLGTFISKEEATSAYCQAIVQSASC